MSTVVFRVYLQVRCSRRVCPLSVTILRGQLRDRHSQEQLFTYIGCRCHANISGRMSLLRYSRVPVVGEESVMKDKPSPLVSFEVVRPFEQPALHLGLPVGPDTLRCSSDFCHSEDRQALDTAQGRTHIKHSHDDDDGKTVTENATGTEICP